MIDRVQLDRALDDLCSQLGICLHQVERDAIAAVPPTTVDALVDLVLIAEGFDPVDLCPLDLRRAARRALRPLI